jgi:hypothetical protein
MRRKGDKKAETISSPSANPAYANGQQEYQNGDIQQEGRSKIQPSLHFVAFFGLASLKHNVYEQPRQLANEHNVAFSGKDLNART